MLDLCYNILQHPGSRCSARDLLIQHRSPILTAGSTLDFARHWQAKLLYLSPCCCDAAAESSAATNVVGRAEHVGDAGAGPRVEAPAHWRRHPARNCHERHAEDNVTASHAQVCSRRGPSLANLLFSARPSKTLVLFVKRPLHFGRKPDGRGLNSPGACVALEAVWPVVCVRPGVS